LFLKNKDDNTNVESNFNTDKQEEINNNINILSKVVDNIKAEINNQYLKIKKEEENVEQLEDQFNNDKEKLESETKEIRLKLN
jgi:chromosome segregation ATPase